MDQEIEKIIKKQMEKLPDEVKKFFVDQKLNNLIKNLAQKNGLSEEQLETLQSETTLVMLGLVHPDEYIAELKVWLSIDNLKVNDLINDINKDILSGIREKLIKIFNTNDESLVEGGGEVKPDWKQNLYFILPKWDYFDFMIPNSPLEEYSTGGGGVFPPSPSQGEGSRVRSIHPGASATSFEPEDSQNLNGPQGRNNIPMKPKMDDIRNKL